MLYQEEPMVLPVNREEAPLDHTADAEETLADILAQALRRIEILESKLNTRQGLDTLAVEVERVITMRLRNTIGFLNRKERRQHS